MKVIIVGAVAGGASVATRLRRLDESADILLLERGRYVSYANCALPYYIGGVITDRAALTALTPGEMRRRFGLDVRTEHEAVAVNPTAKTVTVRNLQTGETYQEGYDKLVLSPGAAPVRPPIPGAEDPRVFTLRTLPDTFRIRAFIEARQPRHAVIVGGGFIGMEMAENLQRAGLRVAVVEMQPQLMALLDGEMAAILHDHVRKAGVDLRLSTRVTGFAPEGDRLCVHLGGEKLLTDLVLLSVGVRPDTAFLRSSGLALTDSGLIQTDSQMRTSDPDVYALGDAVEVTHFVSGLPAAIPLAGPANRQARVVADQLHGLSSHYQGTQGSAIAQVLGLTVAATGLSETGARAAGLSVEKVYTTARSHAAYYPGVEQMTIKVLYERDSAQILGAQLLGGEGVDKRCDVLATAIHARQNAAFLGDLELCYAPPYNSARDPVNMIGYMIGDALAGLIRYFYPGDVPGLLGREDVLLLDVRPKDAYAQGHIPGAVNLPIEELRERAGELPRDKPLYVYCRVGQSSYNACRFLSQQGYDCQSLAGGFTLYQYGGQVEA